MAGGGDDAAGDASDDGSAVSEIVIRAASQQARRARKVREWGDRFAQFWTEASNLCFAGVALCVGLAGTERLFAGTVRTLPVLAVRKGVVWIADDMPELEKTGELLVRMRHFRADAAA